MLTTPSGRRALLRAGGLPGPSPTIVVVHGYTGTPTGIERFAELTDVANSRGIAVAYPEGTTTDQGGFGWNTGAEVFATTTGDDVAAIGEMLDALGSTGCVESAQLTLVGESNGGGLAIVAACSPQLAGRFSRVVVVNAAVDEGVLARCTGATGQTPLTAIGGSLDETVPVLGTAQLLPASDWFAVASSTIAGCRAVVAAPDVDAVVSRTVGTGCGGCSELLVVADGTHTWPGVSRDVSGLTPGTFDLNTLLIDAALAPTTRCLTGLP
ncbi:MAG: alpha/beta hydrolase family esterase [Ilumatobacteraceae bacterium]